VALTLVFVHLVECPNDERAEGYRTAADGDLVGPFFPLAGGNCRLLGTQATPSTRFQRWHLSEQQKQRQHHPAQIKHSHRSLWRPPGGENLSTESVAQDRAPRGS